jgi:hypothetical protein
MALCRDLFSFDAKTLLLLVISVVQKHLRIMAICLRQVLLLGLMIC